MEPMNSADNMILNSWLSAALQFANMVDKSTDEESAAPFLVFESKRATVFSIKALTAPPARGYKRLRKEWRDCLKSNARMSEWCLKNYSGTIWRALDCEYGEDHVDEEDEPIVQRYVRYSPSMLPPPSHVSHRVNCPEFILTFVGVVLLLPKPPCEVLMCKHKRHGKRAVFFAVPRRRGRPPVHCPECVKQKQRPSDLSTPRVQEFRNPK
jgi:hypothetical protein